MIKLAESITAPAATQALDALPLALTVEEAGQVLRVGRSMAYELVRSGQLYSVRVGRLLRVPKQSVIDFLTPAS